MTNQPITDFSTLPPIVAVDFDGTLVIDKFPSIGQKRERMCSAIISLQKLGIKTILWTSRTGTHLTEAIEWCKENGLNFDTVNENIPEVIAFAGEDTRKVYADRYIDDKSFPADGDEIFLKIGRFSGWLGK